MPPKKRVSKKSKSDWRKNVDISKEEEALAAEVRESIYGGAVEKKSDSDLFFEDRQQTKLSKKDAARAKILSANLRVESTSNVPARQSQGAPIDYTSKQVSRLAKKIEAGVKLGPQKRKQSKGIKSDPWAEPQVEIEENEWLPKQEPPKRPASMAEKPSLLPAVPAPDAAASIAPTAKAMRTLKKDVLATKKKKREYQQKLEEQFAYPPSLKRLSAEMTVDAGGGDEVSEADPDVKSDEDDDEDKKNHYSTKLTEKQRREKKLKSLKALKRAKAARKAKLGDFNERVDTMLEQITKREQELEERKQQRLAAKEAKMYGPLKLNTGKLKEENKASLLRKPAKSLSGSIRSSTGFSDRMRSLQMRNILEPKKRISKKNRPGKKRWAVTQSYKAD